MLPNIILRLSKMNTFSGRCRLSNHSQRWRVPPARSWARKGCGLASSHELTQRWAPLHDSVGGVSHFVHGCREDGVLLQVLLFSLNLHILMIHYIFTPMFLARFTLLTTSSWELLKKNCNFIFPAVLIRDRALPSLIYGEHLKSNTRYCCLFLILQKKNQGGGRNTGVKLNTFKSLYLCFALNR